MARQRDYRAEYQRRKARGLAQGLTLEQIRGHAPSPEESVSQLRKTGTLVKGVVLGGVNQVPILVPTADGEELEAVQIAVNKKTASRMSYCWREIWQLLNGEDYDLSSYKNTKIYSLDGKRYQLITDADAIQLWGHTQVNVNDFWRMFESG